MEKHLICYSPKIFLLKTLWIEVCTLKLYHGLVKCQARRICCATWNCPHDKVSIGVFPTKPCDFKFCEGLPPSWLFIPSLLLTLRSTFLSACKTTRSSSSIPFKTGLREQNILREMILCLAMYWNPTNIPDLPSLFLINIYNFFFC